MRIICITAAGLLLAAPALACEYPNETVSNMPNGTSATMDEMLEAQQEVRTYVEAMEGFIECVDEEFVRIAQDEEAAAELDETEQERFRVMVQRRDAAVEQVQEVAEEFNQQVRLFQEREDD